MNWLLVWMAPGKSIKKVSKVGQGLAVFVTQEAKALGWTNKDYVSITSEGEGRSARLVLKLVDF